MLCNNCGQENSSDAIVCSNCEQSLSDVQVQTPPPLTPVNISKEAQNMQNNAPSSIESADTSLATFVGKKYDSYYRERWFKDSIPNLGIDKKDSYFSSSNVAGLFLGAIWLCYRKMYKLAFFIILEITFIDLILMYLLGMEKYNMLGQYTFMIVWIVITGFFGNYFYWKYSVEKIRKITDATADPILVQQQLIKQGGTSWVGAIAVTFLLIMMSGGITYLFAPAWYLTV